MLSVTDAGPGGRKPSLAFRPAAVRRGLPRASLSARGVSAREISDQSASDLCTSMAFESYWLSESRSRTAYVS